MPTSRSNENLQRGYQLNSSFSNILYHTRLYVCFSTAFSGSRPRTPGSWLWRVISVKIMFVLMFWIYTGIKMSVVTLMRWHVELKRDITEYVLTLRRLSWNYDVRLDIMMLICTLYMNKTIVFYKNWMVVLSLWCSSWHYEVHMYNIYEQNKRLLKR